MGLLTFSVRSEAAFPSEPGLIYDLLTDYDAYDWLPFIAKSKLLAKEGDLAIAEFELARPRGKKLVFECIHTRNRMVLIRPIEGKAAVSRLQWDLASAEEGRCRVTLTMEGPRSLRWVISGSRGLLNPDACLNGLRSYLSGFQLDVPLPDSEGEKILELVETDEGMVCWVRGKKYRLAEESASK